MFMSYVIYSFISSSMHSVFDLILHAENSQVSERLQAVKYEMLYWLKDFLFFNGKPKLMDIFFLIFKPQSADIVTEFSCQIIVYYQTECAHCRSCK